MSTHKVLLQPVTLNPAICAAYPSSPLALTVPTPPGVPENLPLGFVVVVNQSPTIRQIVQTTLGRERIEAKTFATGIDMMRWFLGPDKRVPDVFVLDEDLPKMNGYQLAHHLSAKPHFATSRVLLLSEYDRVYAKLRRRLASVHSLLEKPFEVGEFVRTVKALVELSQASQQERR